MSSHQDLDSPFNPILNPNLKDLNPIQPQLLHTISTNHSSILALAVDQKRSRVFSSSEDHSIQVLDLDTYQPITTLYGHQASVLALEIAEERNWLFSSSGDNLVHVWSLETLQPIATIFPASENVGDIYSLKWNPELSTLYLGCQNTSIQWILLHEDLPSSTVETSRAGKPNSVESRQVIPVSKTHKFFDSAPPAQRNGRQIGGSGASTPRARAANLGGGSARMNEILPTATKSDLHSEVLQKATAKLNLQDNPNSGGNASHEVEETPTSVNSLQLSSSSQIPSAHSGYIYALELLYLPAYGTVLASGSGDGEVRIWRCLTKVEAAGEEGSLELLASLETSPRGEVAVLTLASWSRPSVSSFSSKSSHTLFAGLQGGAIDVFDLETFALIRTLPSHQDDVLCLTSVSELESSSSSALDPTLSPTLSPPCLYSGSADGEIRKWNEGFEMNQQWKAHDDGIILSLGLVDSSRRSRNMNASQSSSIVQKSLLLVSGSSDKLLKFWDIFSKSVPRVHFPRTSSFAKEMTDTTFPSPEKSATLLPSLSKFVSFQSVSASSSREVCRQTAHWLKGHLNELGAQSQVLPSSVKGGNPSVLAIFKANISAQALPKSPSGRFASPSRPDGSSVPRCLFYGHYDCIAASGDWDSPPWTLTGRDGYLVGRGVSDNKGPILAAAYAASELLSKRKLSVDFVMLIEGEEESGSVGFKEILENCKEDVGRVDCILVSNSYWLGEETPCLTNGLRGVVRATVKVIGQDADVHSGVEGGGLREPMIDMVKLLSNLSDGERVLIPGFYDNVRSISREERDSYEAVVSMQLRSSSPSSVSTVESLMARWRNPSLTVHRINHSGPGNSTVIPSQVDASISIRIVPDQDLGEITEALKVDIQSRFEALKSSNRVEVTIDHQADWWLGSPDSKYSMALAKSIEKEWGELPISIREGGSIPALPLLEKALSAQCVHLPMGQASDRAHLPNERIRLLNLQKGEAVIKTFLESLGSGEE